MTSQREDVPNMVVSDTRVKAKETELLTRDTVTSSASWGLGVSVQHGHWFSAPPGAPDRRPGLVHHVRMRARQYFYRWHGDDRKPGGNARKLWAQHTVTRTSRRCAFLISPLALSSEFVKRWTLSRSVERQRHKNRWWIHRAAEGIRPTEESFQHCSSRFLMFWLTLPASLPALHLHLKNTAASAAAAAPWSWEVTFPLSKKSQSVRGRKRLEGTKHFNWVFFSFFCPFWVPVTSRHGEYVCRTV